MINQDMTFGADVKYFSKSQRHARCYSNRTLLFSMIDIERTGDYCYLTFQFVHIKSYRAIATMQFEFERLCVSYNLHTICVSRRNISGPSTASSLEEGYAAPLLLRAGQSLELWAEYHET
jgi:hypothetical protein